MRREDRHSGAAEVLADDCAFVGGCGAVAAATSAMPPYDLGLSGTGNRRVAFFDLFYGKKREGLWAVLLLGTSNPTICL